MERRTFIRQAAAGTLALGAISTVSATDDGLHLVASESDVRSRLEGSGYEIKTEIVDGRLYSVLGATDAADLEEIDGVTHAVPNARIELEEPELVESEVDADGPEFYELQWDKQVTDVLPAHKHATGEDRTIAIIDTGVAEHPDLENLDTEKSKKFKFGEIEGYDGDPYGHGTHVAGIAAGTGENGIVGTAPDAELVSLQVFYYVEPEDPDEDPVLTTTTEDILNAVTYAAEMGADVANLSLGTPPLPPQYNAGGYRGVLTPVYQNAVAQGTVVTASAGNDAYDLQGGHFSTPNGVPGTMSISATGPNDELVFYSNYGTGQVDVGAPGGGYETLEKTLSDDTEWPYPTNLVLSSVPEDVYGTQYAYFAGTSMAAPQVAGLAALVRELEPETTAQQVETAIKAGAEYADGQSDAELGAGRINAEYTVENLE
ncbi:S8 family peptidase [Natronobacterium lacisalsi]|nr:S8 family serine peptidase [Halobiforma lacisalsi]EMA28537.1 peptidase S8/S53 subtilisin kexin sedolisin [Halobiforma lacisalsi AJ5]